MATSSMILYLAIAAAAAAVCAPILLENMSGSTEPAPVLLLAAVAVAVAVAAIILHRMRRPRLRLPPGPRGLPIFGCILQMPRIMRNEGIDQLRAVHGPILTLPIGSTPLVLVTGAEIAHEALVEKGAVFASRPPPMSRQAVLSNNGRSINTAVYGPHWRAVRRNLVSGVLGPARVLGFVQARQRAVDDLVERLRTSASTGMPVPVLSSCRFTVFSILSYMCFGRWLGDETVKQMELLMRELITGVRGSIADFVPLARLLRFLFKTDKKLLELRERRHRFLMPIIEESKQLEKQGKIDRDCYLASLFLMQQQQQVSDEDLVLLCAEFLNAGADTTANTLEWAMANLVKFPRIQSKLFDEIRAVMGKKKHGAEAEAELDKLPYLQAVVKETLRRHPPGYTTLPHAVTQPCKLAGYDIPTNAMVLFHVLSIGNDPKLWTNPTEFLPERFVGDSAVHADFTASSTGQLNLIPFSAGRRICPGLGLATLHIHLILARLVQEFEWSAEVQPVDMSPKMEFTVVMRNPLRAVIRERSASSKHVDRSLA